MGEPDPPAGVGVCGEVGEAAEWGRAGEHLVGHGGDGLEVGAVVVGGWCFVAAEGAVEAGEFDEQ